MNFHVTFKLLSAVLIVTGAISTSTGYRQNIGTPIGRLGKLFGLFPYYDIDLRVLKLDGLAVIFSTRGLLYGTNLIYNNLFCDVIFSLMRIICHTQYI
jgi:hypothetical protein